MVAVAQRLELWEQVDFGLPTHADDFPKLSARVMENKSKLGLVNSRWELLNQNNEEVMQMEGYGMFRRRAF